MTEENMAQFSVQCDQQQNKLAEVEKKYCYMKLLPENVFSVRTHQLSSICPRGEALLQVHGLMAATGKISSTFSTIRYIIPVMIRTTPIL